MAIDLLCVNFNTKDLLKRLLDSLIIDSETAIWNFYLQDNGSTDGSKEFINTLIEDDYPIDKYISHANVGYARAINDLATYGTNEIIGILNADVWLSTTQVKAIQKTFDDHPEQAIMGPKQTSEDNKIRFGGIFWSAGPHKLKHRGWSQVDPNDKLYKDRVECATVSGSAYFIRRSVWNALKDCAQYKQSYPDATGAFLPVPLMYYEETFCSMHAAHHGFKVIYDGTIPTIGHTWAASTGGPNEMLGQYMEQSKQMYIEACEAHGIRNEFN